MTDNRTTELLCKLLEERGVSCRTHYLYTSWYVGPKLYYAVDNLDGTLTIANLTPEQAIAATLGSGTCEITATATTDTEFARAVHDGNLWRRVKGHIRCRNCGLNIESVIALDGCNEHAIKHCPNCGKEV